MNLKVGEKAPDFDLPTYPNARLSLKNLKGKNVVLYFYPKDMTPGCTTQAEDFRDRVEKFERINTLVIGASKDSPKRHETFKAKFQLNFQLIADEDGALCEAYGVWQKKKFMGREFMGIIRTTFLIDSVGVIRNVWPKVKVKGHAKAVLTAASDL